MNAQDLQKMKEELYKTALADGTIGKISFICRELTEGNPCSYGPKYNLTVGDLKIHVDGYGHYMTVRKDGKLLCSTHNEQLFAVGDWYKAILALLPKAEEIKEKRELVYEQKRSKELKEQLGLAGN